jgi:hypothetical protein
MLSCAGVRGAVLPHQHASNSIALLAGAPDLPSRRWLGRYAERTEIRESDRGGKSD